MADTEITANARRTLATAVRAAAARVQADPAARGARCRHRGRRFRWCSGRRARTTRRSIPAWPIATSVRSRRSSTAPTCRTSSTRRRAACSCRPTGSTKCACSSHPPACRAAPASASRRCRIAARSGRRRSWRTRCTCVRWKPSSRARSAACSPSRWRACTSRCRRSRCSCGRSASRARPSC